MARKNQSHKISMLAAIMAEHLDLTRTLIMTAYPELTDVHARLAELSEAAGLCCDTSAVDEEAPSQGLPAKSA